MLEKKNSGIKERCTITLDRDIMEYLDKQMKLGYNRSQAANEIIRQAKDNEKSNKKIKN